MTEYYHVVPWFNSKEWLKVYELIYSPNSTFENKYEALKQLLVWKARCPSLPSGVESSLTLLEVYVQDVKNSEDVMNEQLLRLAYSSALMRFVNHMLDNETAKGSSLYQAAKNLGVPDWIIDMRHDTAHSNNLPSLELLREACLISIDWLQKYYWDKHKLCIKDYVAGQKDTNINEENKIAALLNYCFSLSICAHTKIKIKNLSEIPNAVLRESIINDTRDLFGDFIDLSNLKKVSIMSLVNIVNSQSKKFLKSQDSVSHVKTVLLGHDSLFLSLELLNEMGDKDFYYKNKLSRQYVQCFEFLLTFLHSNNLLLDIIMELIRITECSDGNTKSDQLKCRLAALWVSEILIALRKCKQFVDKIKKNNSEDFASKKGKDLKQLFHHWFPNEKIHGLLLDLQKPVPSELMDVNFVRPIISTYNPYLTIFIKDLLNLVEPHLPKEVTDKICKLAQLISNPEKFPSVSSKIYTVDDLIVQEKILAGEDDSDCQMYSDPEVSAETKLRNKTEKPNNIGIWRPASSEHNWHSCPIGLLPWQQKIDDEVTTE